MQLNFSFDILNPFCSISSSINRDKTLFSLSKKVIKNYPDINIFLKNEEVNKILRVFFTQFSYNNFNFPLYDIIYKDEKLSDKKLTNSNYIREIIYPNSNRTNFIKSYLDSGFLLSSNEVPLLKDRLAYIDSDDPERKGFPLEFFEKNQLNSVNFLIKRPNIVLDFDSKKLKKDQLYNRIIEICPILKDCPTVETLYGFHFHILCFDTPPITQLNLNVENFNMDIFCGGMITVPPSVILNTKSDKADIWEYKWIKTGKIPTITWKELVDLFFRKAYIKIVLKEFELKDEKNDIRFIDKI